MIKRIKSIKTELFILFFIILAIVVGLSILLNTVLLESYYIYKTEQEFVEISKEIENILTADNIEEELFEIDRNKQVSILVLNNGRQIVTTSYQPDPPLASHMEREINNILLSQRESLRNEYFYKKMPTGPESQNLIFINRVSSGVYIVLMRTMLPVNSNIAIMNEFYVLSGVFAIFVASIFSLKIFNNFTRPIIEISRVTKNISNMNFGEKIKYTKENELGDLSKSVNRLSEKLEKNINNLQNEVEFQRVFSRNVSHELKTPIAVVKGYAEGIFYGIADSEEMQKQYLSTIIEECDRMDTLVQDILLLSKLSATTDKIRTMEYSHSKTLEEKILSIFTALMEQKGIDFRISIPDINIFANQELLLQLISNFISNAMKYGDQKQINLDIFSDEKNIVIKVFNTGEPVMQEEIDKIFDEFYVTDRARTRDVNGHGLGLAISKSIAQFHSGRIYAENQENGVCFTLSFPKVQK